MAGPSQTLQPGARRRRSSNEPETAVPPYWRTIGTCIGQLQFPKRSQMQIGRKSPSKKGLKGTLNRTCWGTISFPADRRAAVIA